MPSGRTHLIVGLGVSCVLTYASKLPIETVAAGLLGSLWPDTDKRGSLLGRFIPLWLLCKHRGFTHSWIGLFVFVTFVKAWWSPCAAWVFAGGYFSHLLIDWRVPWLWPRRRRRRR